MLNLIGHSNFVDALFLEASMNHGIARVLLPLCEAAASPGGLLMLNDEYCSRLINSDQLMP